MTLNQHDEIGPLLRETYRAMIARVEHQFEDAYLGFTQWLTLKLIADGHVTCLRDIHREIGLDSGAITRMIDQLEARGLLARRRSAADRRVIGIFLTPSGAATVEEMLPKLASFWQARLYPFSTNERDVLVSLLVRLRDVLGEDISEPRPQSIRASS